MKLAVLGTDPDIVALVAAATQAGHAIVWLGDVRQEERDALRELLPGLRVSDDWESLLDHRLADAVLVGRGNSAETLRAEQLKRLAADIMPVLAVHPIGTSVLAYFELDMARHEVHGILRHFAPLAGAPAIEQMHDWVATGAGPIGPIGAIHQIILQRSLDDCGRDSIIRHLARDAEVLRRVAGGIRTVSAVGPRAADASYASLQVQMTTPGSATVRWAVAPTQSGANSATLQLVGDRGTAEFDLAPGADSIRTNIGGSVDEISLPKFAAPRVAIDQLAASLVANGTDRSEAASTWQTATAAMEVVDTIELSLQKGRTIEVHQQRLTEQLAFRGTMAAFGCGLLLVAFFVLILAGVIGDILGINIRQFWPIALLAVLALFLLMQALPWLVKRRKPTADAIQERGR